MNKQLLKTIFSLLFLALFPVLSSAQVLCGSTFSDPAGPNVNYANNENSTTIICPDNPTDYVTVTFGSFSLENNFDFLRVYDGTSASAPLIATLTGTALPNAISSSTPGGCLTFVFTSDSSVTALGWVAFVSCTPTVVQPCLEPTQLTVSGLTNNSATLSWGENGTATSWEVLALPCGTAPSSTSVGMVVQDNPFVLNNLGPTTCYTVYVRAICNTNEFSPWSSGLTFTTLSNPVAPPVCGGQFIDNGGTGNYLNNTNQTTTICPSVSGDLVTVTFNYFDTEVNWDALYVYDGNSSTSPQIASSNTGGYVPGGLPGGFWGTTIPGPFTSSSADGCLTFVFISDGSVNRAGWVADVTCEPMPTCPKPINLNITYNNPSSLTLNWTETGSATAWEVLALPLGSPAPTVSDTGIAITSNPYTFTGLTDVAYQFYVRAICSSTDASNWSHVLNYYIPSCSEPINVSVTGVTANNATVYWSTASQGISQFEVLILPAGSPAPSATDSGIATNSYQYTASGLAPNTSYDVYVKTVCSSSYSTNWSSVVSFTTSQSFPPLIADTTFYTPEQLVNNVLINNPCIEITNVTSSTGTNFGTVNGIGYFTNSNPTFPISSGIVLSTGNAANIAGPNTTVLGEGNSSWVGDSQLENIITTATGTLMDSYNATKLEFDFTSLNEFMSFNFLFASEEYGYFQCNYSDAFAFLLTDLESGVTTNLAVVPGTTTPVSVVTIRDMLLNTNCSSMNPAFFGMNNQGANTYSSATNFNGQTVEMTASSTILPNHPYHIKLVVADRGDSVYDSAVFIEAGSFTSGPPQCSDKIQLVAFIDENGNGVKDNNEVNFTYGSFVYQQNNAGSVYNITSPMGSYNLYDADPANTYDFNYEINSEFAPYYTLSSINYNDINITLGSGTQVLYFPITLTQPYNDVAVSVIPVSAPRPGFTYINKIVYKNLGVSPASGTISFTKDASVTINSVSQSGIVTNTDGFSYDFTNLYPYETRTIYVTMSVPALPTVAIGDLLTNNASITAASDINATNNVSANTQAVVASYDPNDKMEAHGGKIQYNQFSSNDYLYYTVRFQNTGTINAVNIKIEDVLDSRFDEESIRMVSASHNYIMERVGPNLIWKFDYIQLPSYLQSDELSKGYVMFKVKLKAGFAVGDIIPNTANIYFDNNPAITTNTFNTEFVAALSNASFASSNFMLFPNPASNNVQINLLNTEENIDKIVFYDVLGKTLKEIKSTSEKQISIDISDLSKGVYMVEIKTESGLKQIKKLVVE